MRHRADPRTSGNPPAPHSRPGTDHKHATMPLVDMPKGRQ